jgi:hypothetical protein
MYESEVREMLAGERAEALVALVEGAWAEMVSRKMPSRKRTRASVMWDNMLELADQLLVPLDGVHRFELRRIPMYAIDDRIAIRFKKHNEAGLTRSVWTDHQRALVSQQPIDGLAPGIVHLPCGYKLDRTGSEISHVVLSKPIRITKTEWEIDLRELISGEGTPYTAPLSPIVPNLGTTALPGVRPSEEKAGEDTDS